MPQGLQISIPKQCRQHNSDSGGHGLLSLSSRRQAARPPPTPLGWGHTALQDFKAGALLPAQKYPPGLPASLNKQRHSIASGPRSCGFGAVSWRQTRGPALQGSGSALAHVTENCFHLSLGLGAFLPHLHFPPAPSPPSLLSRAVCRGRAAFPPGLPHHPPGKEERSAGLQVAPPLAPRFSAKSPTRANILSTRHSAREVIKKTHRSLILPRDREVPGAQQSPADPSSESLSPYTCLAGKGVLGPAAVLLTQKHC